MSATKDLYALIPRLIMQSVTCTAHSLGDHSEAPRASGSECQGKTLQRLQRIHWMTIREWVGVVHLHGIKHHNLASRVRHTVMGLHVLYRLLLIEYTRPNIGSRAVNCAVDLPLYFMAKTREPSYLKVTRIKCVGTVHARIFIIADHCLRSQQLRSRALRRGASSAWFKPCVLLLKLYKWKEQSHAGRA